MRILFTTPFSPYPPTYGGTITPYYHLQGLAERGHQIEMVLPLRRPGDADGIPFLSQFGRVRCVRVSEKSAPVFALEALVSGTSLRIARHRFASVQREITSALCEQEFDVVYLDSFFTTYLLPEIRRRAPRTPVVLLTHNVESQVMRRLAQQRGDLAIRLVSLWELPWLQRNEQRAYEGLTRVITFSEEDATTIQITAPRARTVMLGPGIETHSGEAIPGPQERIVLFLGSYLWPPNVDAAEWMTRDIWPRVRARVSNARLILAGHDPGAKVAPLANEGAGIFVAGRVENAMRITRTAAVCVAPLRIGGGVRLKIIEALANERPVVTTTIGAEGLGLNPDEHAHFADDPESFAAAIASLLMDKRRAERSAQLGRKYVEDRFGWPRVIERLEKILEDTVRGSRR